MILTNLTALPIMSHLSWNEMNRRSEVLHRMRSAAFRLVKVLGYGALALGLAGFCFGVFFRNTLWQDRCVFAASMAVAGCLIFGSGVNFCDGAFFVTKRARVPASICFGWGLLLLFLGWLVCRGVMNLKHRGVLAL